MYRRLALLLTFLCAGQSALALPQKCNGRIRHRPCEASDFEPKAQKIGPAQPHKQLQSHGEVSEVTLKKDKLGKFGVWRGFVRGKGQLQLVLKILKPATPNFLWKLGQIELSPEDGPIRFTFKAPLPEGPAWSWEILAKPLS